MEFILGEEEHTCDNDKEIAIVMCEVCSKEVRKYKCPRCGVSTCSMQCCKNHKIAVRIREHSDLTSILMFNQSGCTGKRERIQYVAVNEFTDKHLRADYHFLEDVLQTRVGAKRNFTHLGGGGIHVYQSLFSPTTPQVLGRTRKRPSHLVEVSWNP